MGDREEFAKGYLKGFEDALNEVWSEVLSMGSRAYSPQELQILARTRKSMIPQSLAMKRMELQKSLGVTLSQPGKQDAPEIVLTPGATILVREERPDKAFHIFTSIIAGGRRGLSVTRMDPSRIIGRYGLDAGDISFIWLTKIERDEVVQDGRRYAIMNGLSGLASEIRSFYGKGKENAVVLEGMEYLITQNDFRSVLRFIQMVNEQAEYSGGYFILSVDRQSVDEKDYRLLEKEMAFVV